MGPFWGLLRSMIGGSADTDAFGNPLQGYVIVESNGSIEALDALRVCEEGIARSGLSVQDDGLDRLEDALPLVRKAIHEGFQLASECQSCPERAVCGGGYLPHRYSRARGFDNPSVWCADILKLLRHIRQQADSTA